MKRFLSIIAAEAFFVVSLTAGTVSSVLPTMTVNKVPTNSVSGNAGLDYADCSMKANGHLEAIIVDVSMDSDAVVTGGTNPASPSPNQFFTASGTYLGQTAYVSDDGNYWAWNYTNTTFWVISTNKGTQTGVAWTNFNASAFTNNYLPAVVGSGATGTLVLTQTSIDIDIDVTATGGTIPTTTLFSKDDVTADATYYITVQKSDTGGSAVSGEYADIPLIGNIIRLRAYDAAYSNVNVSIKPIVK